jgi:hypothetical protein
LRDFAVGIIVVIIIAACIVYLYDPGLYEVWFRRLVLE